MIKVTVTQGNFVKTVRFIGCESEADAIDLVKLEYDERSHQFRAEKV